MALTKRSTKGTALTHNEMDANFTHLGGDGTYTMPTTDGDSGQVMSTNGEGQVTFTTLSGVTATIANAYPVGSLYMNASNATNPATLLGFGTWTAFGAGRVLIGIDSGDTDFDTAEETGGSKTHALTIGELASHNHTVGSNDSGTGTGGAAGNMELVRDAGTGNGPAVTSSTTGDGDAHNNVQPYIVVYMWKRTA
jgi:microcystin-dependent protein